MRRLYGCRSCYALRPRRFHSDKRVFGIKDEDRFFHMYVIGKTGTGKSTSLRTWRFKTWSAATASR